MKYVPKGQIHNKSTLAPNRRQAISWAYVVWLHMPTTDTTHDMFFYASGYIHGILLYIYWLLKDGINKMADIFICIFLIEYYYILG